MAITKLVSPSTPNPTGTGAGASWDLAMAQLTAVKTLLNNDQIALTGWEDTTTVPKLRQGTYLNHLGSLYVVTDEDYTLPALSTDGDSFLCFETSGTTLVPYWDTDRTLYAYNYAYSGMYKLDNINKQMWMFGVQKASTVYKKFRVLMASNLMVFGNGHVASLSGYLNIVSPTSIAGNLGVTGGLVVDSPAIMAGGLTVMEYLQYGATRIDIPTIDDLPVLAAGATNLIAGVTSNTSKTENKTLSGTVKSPFGARVSVTAVARVYESSYQGSGDWAESTVTVTLKKNGVTIATASAHVLRYGHNLPTGSYTQTDTQTSGNIDTTFSIGDTITFVVTITTGSSGDDLYPSGTGSHTGFNCDRTLNSIAGETLALV